MQIQYGSHHSIKKTLELFIWNRWIRVVLWMKSDESNRPTELITKTKLDRKISLNIHVFEINKTSDWAISKWGIRYCDVITGAIASQITSLTIVYSTIYSGADQRKHQSSASLVFVREIHRSPVNFPHKRPVTWKMFSFDDVIMTCGRQQPI